MPPRGGFTYDPRSARYRDARGRFVAPAQVRAWLDVALDNAADRIDALASQLRRGEIDLISWQVRMAREVKNVQLYSAAMAKGGWAQLSNADLGRVGQAVRAQLEYLNNFANEIRSGRQRLNGTINSRAELYVHAGRGLYERTRRAELVLRGYDRERSLRHSGDSCAGCIEAEALGWQPIGVIVPIGARQCLSRCRCTFQFENNATGKIL